MAMGFAEGDFDAGVGCDAVFGFASFDFRGASLSLIALTGFAFFTTDDCTGVWSTYSSLFGASTGGSCGESTSSVSSLTFSCAWTAAGGSYVSTTDLFLAIVVLVLSGSFFCFLKVSLTDWRLFCGAVADRSLSG